MLKKSFLLIILCFSLVLPSTFAETDLNQQKSQERYSLSTVEGLPDLYDNVDKVHYAKAWTVDGKEISLSEYKKLLETKTVGKPKNNSLALKPLSDPSTGDLSYYSETLHFQGYGTPKTASQSINCTGSAQACPITATTSVTSTDSWNAGITAGDKSYVKAAVGYTWATSSTSSLGYTLYVPVNKTGHLTFATKYNYTLGNVIHKAMINWVIYNYPSVYIDASTPVKIGNFSDGVWALALN